MRPTKRSTPMLLAFLAGLCCVAPRPATPQDAPAEGTPLPVIDVPEVDVGKVFLERRRAAQLATADRFAVEHDFSFTDRLATSGITFHHQSVDDGGIEYKMVHYDHGNGLAMADVDGDGLTDLYFTSQNGPNALWHNEGDGTFREITAEAGVAVADRVSMGGSFADYDNDGDPDLFVTTVRMGNVLFRNDGSGHFDDVSREAGVDFVGHSSAGLFFDYDNDGLLDLFLANVGVFTKDEQGRGGYWIGVDDAFQGHLHPERVERSILYRNLGNGRFEDVSKAVGLVDDGWNIFGNAFYRNAGDGSFEEVSDQVGAENYWPWGPSIADLNADGWEDVFIASSMSFPFRYGINTVLLNNLGRTFLDSEFILGVEPRPEGHTSTPWFEIDCSGRDAAHTLCSGREGRYQVRGTLGTRSAAIFDLDGDGDLDIVTLEFHAQPQVLVSDLASRRAISYLELELEGVESNRSGLGARVRVQVGERTLYRQVDGKSGYISQSDAPLYIGLGDATRVDRIEVRWPSGKVDVVSEGIGRNRRVTIKEGVGLTEPLS